MRLLGGIFGGAVLGMPAGALAGYIFALVVIAWANLTDDMSPGPVFAIPVMPYLGVPLGAIAGAVTGGCFVRRWERNRSTRQLPENLVEDSRTWPPPPRS